MKGKWITGEPKFQKGGEGKNLAAIDKKNDEALKRKGAKYGR